MRISDWSSDVCSSDLTFTKVSAVQPQSPVLDRRIASRLRYVREGWHRPITNKERQEYRAEANAALIRAGQFEVRAEQGATAFAALGRSEEHTSELQSLMRISYAVSCLTKKKTKTAQ